MKKSVLIVLVLGLVLPLTPPLSFSINAQEVGIEPLLFNTLYKGVENPIKVVVENYDCDSILVSSESKVRLIRPCHYIVVPFHSGVVTIDVKGINNNDTIALGRYKFRVLTTPDPIARVGGRTGGALTIGFLIAQYGITAELDDFIVDVNFKIDSYTVLIERDKRITFNKDYKGNVFPEELKSHFRNLRSGDTVVFESLVASGPDNSPRELETISFKIR